MTASLKHSDITAAKASHRLAAVSFAGVLATAAFAAACGSSSSTSAGGTSSTSPAAGGGGSHQVTVSETEFHILPSQSTLTAGTYTFKAVNNGSINHTLEIMGPNGVMKVTGMLQPGQSENLTVTLAAGSYEFVCTVAGHKELGMDTHIQVSG